MSDDPPTDEWSTDEPSTHEPLPRVLAAALDLFAEQGYHGTGIRDIAAAAGLSVPGVYHHYASKQVVLQELMVAVMSDLLARMEAAFLPDETGVQERFDALVGALLRFHLDHRREAFVASSELRSLDADQRAVVVGMRDRAQGMVRDLVAAGCAEGEFTTPDPDEAARAVAVLCVGVATWYREDGPLAPEAVVRTQLGLARALVGAVTA